MSKNIFIATLCICVAVLLYFLLSGGKEHDSHKDDYAQVKAERDSFKIHETKALIHIDSLELNIRQQDTVIKYLVEERDYVRRDLDKSKAQATRLSKEVKEHSTVNNFYFTRQADSLANETENLVFLLTQYERYSDSVTLVNAQQKEEYNNRDTERQRLYAELRRGYDDVNVKYNNLYRDYQGARKDIKRERLKTKVAAVLALVATGLFIVK